MTPEQRRAKYQLPEPTPLSDDELEKIRERAQEWLERPAFTEASLDRLYHTQMRFLATLKERCP